MSVIVRPLGVSCNIACDYCYQNKFRTGDHVDPRRGSLASLLDQIENLNEPFVVFGGEPLMLPIRDLRRLFEKGLKKAGYNQLQTNGVLISPEHLDLFQEFKVRVGVSCDGPGALNDARWFKNLERTRVATDKTLRALSSLLERKIPVSLISTLSRHNASSGRISTLAAWFIDLHAKGIRQIRLHTLETHDAKLKASLCLTGEEYKDAFDYLYQTWRHSCPDVDFDVFRETRSLLLGEDEKVSCTWLGCDPYATDGVNALQHDGSITNCHSATSTSVDYLQSSRHGYERYLGLYGIPEADGGCGGCRFFMMCKGHCPGDGAGGDWRNKTQLCQVYKHLFSRAEADLLAQGLHPLSLSEERQSLEQEMVAGWERGENPSIAGMIAARRGAAATEVNTAEVLEQVSI